MAILSHRHRPLFSYFCWRRKENNNAALPHLHPNFTTEYTVLVWWWFL